MPDGFWSYKDYYTYRTHSGRAVAACGPAMSSGPAGAVVGVLRGLKPQIIVEHNIGAEPKPSMNTSIHVIPDALGKRKMRFQSGTGAVDDDDDGYDSDEYYH